MGGQFVTAQERSLAMVRLQMIRAAEAQHQSVVAAHHPSAVTQTIDSTAIARRNEVLAITAYAAFKIGSKIRYRYSYMDDIVKAALEYLRKHSPVGGADDKHPGLYRDSHLLFIDGRVASNARDWLPGQQINISNPMPYARKIEAGRIKMNVPAHVYEDAAQVLADRFAGRATIQFTYMPVRIGANGQWANITQLQRDGRRLSVRARRDWLARQPALQISAR